MFCPDINSECKGQECRDWSETLDSCIIKVLNSLEQRSYIDKEEASQTLEQLKGFILPAGKRRVGE